MKITDQTTLSHIQRLPDEVLARLFIVGSWLPGRMPKANYPNSPETMHPLRLKPYAKLISQVCSRWRSIVYWQSNRRELYHAAISLRYSESPTNPAEIASILKAYLDDIVNSEGAELDVEWHFFRIIVPGGPPSINDLVVPLFLHGMNLTAPHFHRVRSLTAYFAEPEVIAFCFLLLNNLANNLVLTHLKISAAPILSKDLIALAEPSVMPTCASLSGSPDETSFSPIAPFSALSHLMLAMPLDAVKKFIIPTNLLHLSLSDISNTESWDSVWAVIRKCGYLRTLAIGCFGSTTLPNLSSELIIHLPYLLELTFLHASMWDLAVLLRLLITPCLKHLYFGGFSGREEIESNITRIWSESSILHTTSQGHPFRAFPAPRQVSIREVDQKTLQTAIECLLPRMALDAVEQVWIEHKLVNYSRPDNPELSLILHTIDVRLMVQTILNLCRRHSSRGIRKAKDDALPEVRLMSSNGRLLLSSLDHA